MIILNLATPTGKLSLIFLLTLFFLNVGTAAARQVTPAPEKPAIITAPTPKPTPKAEPKVTVTVRPPKAPNPRAPQVKTIARNESETPAEKFIATDPKVNISLCVMSGNVKINGWQRDEVRAFVGEGSEVGFKVAQKSESGKPVWIFVYGFDPAKSRTVNTEECLSGEEIELDVPHGATVNLKSHRSETRIESVGKVRVENVDGDIFLNEIEQGIEAKTYRGEIMVKRSGGSIILTNAEGNIVALEVTPTDFGDYFKAKTNNGTVILQQVGHRQIDVSSISGSIGFTGAFLSGGQYGFGTQNGSILMTIPENSSCKIRAWYGFGAFASDLPLVNVQKQAQSLSGDLGSGECSLSLRTLSGRIGIRKQ